MALRALRMKVTPSGEFMFDTVMPVVLPALASALMGCEQTTPTPIPTPAITGAFALRLVEGNPLPILVRERFDILAYPDRLLVADAFEVGSFSYQRRLYTRAAR